VAVIATPAGRTGRSARTIAIGVVVVIGLIGLIVAAQWRRAALELEHAREAQMVTEKRLAELQERLQYEQTARRTVSQGAGPNASIRVQLIEDLFDPNPSVRKKAYGGLLPRYEDDPTLIPELLGVARANPRNVDGLYNTLVVLSHMNKESLRPHSNEIRSFAEASKSVGPKVAERSNTLLSRLPM
jgi:hypothetical protein